MRKGAVLTTKVNDEMVDLMPEKVKVAAVQASPVFMDKEATIEKACHLIKEAGKKDAELIVFPETFISAYPSAWTMGWDSDAEAVAKVFVDFQDNSLVIPSNDCEILCDAARAANAYVVIGCNELDDRVGSRTLYNSLLFIDRRGIILGKHRKLMPTWAEKLYHARGDGSDLNVYETEIGRLGGLICYEHHMPLIKAALMMKGEEIHAAVWPGHWGGEAVAGFDINKCDITPATREYAFEAQCFVVSAHMILTMGQVPDEFPFKRHMKYEGKDQGDYVMVHCGGSHVVGPFSEFLVEPRFGKEEIVYAECDLNERKLAKAYLDVMGHYARWDVARLDLREESWKPFTPKAQEIRPTQRELEAIAHRYEVSVDKLEKLIAELVASLKSSKKRITSSKAKNTPAE